MAGYIPKDFLALLLQRIDLVTLIDIKVPLRKKSAHNYFACCPFHQEKTASFCVNQNKQFYYCFGCGAHGNAIDFLLNYERLNFVEAVTSLAQQAGMQVPGENQVSAPKFKQKILFSALQAAESFYAQELRNTSTAQAYLSKRGIHQETIAAFNLGYAPSQNSLPNAVGDPQLLAALTANGLLLKQAQQEKYYARFRDRIMFPIHDRQNRCVGFGGRIINAGDPKYLNSPDTELFSKGKELYGLAQALTVHRNLPYAIIVEGYMDVITLFQHGITTAVATLGTATTEYQIKSLLRYTNHIVFCFDGDSAGRRAAFRALQVILPFMPDNVAFNFMFLPEGEDPDSLIRSSGKETFLARLKAADTLSQYFLHTIAGDLDLSTVDGKTLYLNNAMEYLQKLPDGIFKNTLLTEIEYKTRTNLAQFMSQHQHKKPIITQHKASTRLSALRYALALLIQYPHLAQHIAEPFAVTTLPGITLFNDVLTQIQADPNISTGSLLEFWRDQPEAKWLASLAQQEFLITEQRLPLELLGAMQQISKQIQNQQIQHLLAKSSASGLSSQEREEIMHLLKKRNELDSDAS